MSTHALLLPVTRDDEARMIDVQDDGARRGLVLVTDGRELKYTLPHLIPPGWLRFAMIHRIARAPDPREPVLGSGA